MADNYLEKKMEEHRQNSSSSAHRPLRQSSAVGIGDAKIRIALKRVVVDIASERLREAIVKQLCAAGCKVAFQSDEPKAGSRLAQGCGARYYPKYTPCEMISDLCSRWGGVDLLVSDRASVRESVRTLLVTPCSVAEPKRGDTASVVCPGLDIGEVERIAGLCLYVCTECSLFATYGTIELLCRDTGGQNHS